MRGLVVAVMVAAVLCFIPEATGKDCWSCPSADNCQGGSCRVPTLAPLPPIKIIEIVPGETIKIPVMVEVKPRASPVRYYRTTPKRRLFRFFRFRR